MDGITGRAARQVGGFALVLVVAAAVVVADQGSKALAAGALAQGRVIALLGGMVYLDYSRNTGAAFSVLQSHGMLFIVIAAVVIGGILLFHQSIAASRPLVRLGVGLVLGGATGNLIDRVRLGYVVDFIDLRWWPVFNLADSALVIGVLILVVISLIQEAAA